MHNHWWSFEANDGRECIIDVSVYSSNASMRIGIGRFWKSMKFKGKIVSDLKKTIAMCISWGEGKGDEERVVCRLFFTKRSDAALIAHEAVHASIYVNSHYDGELKLDSCNRRRHGDVGDEREAEERVAILTEGITREVSRWFLAGFPDEI